MWSELAPVTDVNDDGVLDEDDVPIWQPFNEVIVGGRRESMAKEIHSGVNPKRPGRVFRRRCQCKRKLITERYKQTLVVQRDKFTNITTIEISAKV